MNSRIFKNIYIHMKNSHIFMWESVWEQGPSYEQTLLAMENTLFRVSIFDGEQIVEWSIRLNEGTFTKQMRKTF